MNHKASLNMCQRTRINGCSPLDLGCFCSSEAVRNFASRSAMSECAYANLFFTPDTLTASMIDA